MKLEIGMYVRTVDDGIQKITKVTTNGCFYRTCRAGFDYKTSLNEGDIIGEPSFNILDLIEENDVVVIRQNGDLYKYEVFSVPAFSEQKLYVYENVLGKTTTLFLEDIPKEYIVSIVTKEQFEAMKYEIK